jgi:hypothetical protein
MTQKAVIDTADLHGLIFGHADKAARGGGNIFLHH